MVYGVDFKNEVTKFFKKNRKWESQFRNAFFILAGDIKRESEESKKLDIKELKYELSGLYRLRINDYRAIFSIDHNIIIISVIRIKHRKDVYEKR